MNIVGQDSAAAYLSPSLKKQTMPFINASSVSPVKKIKQQKNVNSSNSSVTSNSAFSTSSRLYRAPQPSIRKNQKVIVHGVDQVGRDPSSFTSKADKVGSTRRRRGDILNKSTSNINYDGNHSRQNARKPRPERQRSENSLNVDGISGSYSNRNLDYNSDVEDVTFGSNNDVAMSSSFHGSVNDLSMSSRKSHRTNKSSNSTKRSLLQQRHGFRSSHHSSRTLPTGNAGSVQQDSYSENYNNDDDSGVGSGHEASQYQSDILFVEGGGAHISNSKVPLYKSWMKTLRKINRQPSNNLKSHPMSSNCHFVPFRLSCYVTYINSSCRKKNRWGWWQILIFIIFGIIIFDSRKTIHKHRIQIQLYDEERAHILEQMTWIDRAAKRVHSNYYQNNMMNNGNIDASNSALLLGTVIKADSEAKEDVNLMINTKNERDIVRQELDKIQIKIQANARDRIQRLFSEKPIQVSLPLYPEEGSDSNDIEHLVIALWDDTPHAALTLIQQINDKIWDELDFQRVETSVNPVPGKPSHHNHQLDCIQIAPKSFTVSVSPSLEFVEKSRRCNHPGSVAIHQLESDDFHIMVLKVNIAEDSQAINHDEGDVCIGTVVTGLEKLLSRLPRIPIIHKEDDDDEEHRNITEEQKLMQIPTDEKITIGTPQRKVMPIDSEVNNPEIV